MNTNSNTKKVVIAALFAALTCVATIVIKIPYSSSGYFNMGDCIVLLAGWLLSPLYAAMAAGIGSALADVILGSVVYAPASFIIKMLMALVASWGLKAFSKSMGDTFSKIISSLFAEIIMVGGYFVFEGAFLYGFAASMLYIPANLIQAVVGMLVAIVLAKVFQKNKIIK